MKNILLILFLIPEICFGQALFLPINVKNAETKKPIPQIVINSEWAGEKTTDEKGNCELSFALNGDENYVLLNFISEKYKLFSENQICVPTNWNTSLPWELNVLTKEKYIEKFNQYFKSSEKFLLKNNKTKLNARHILLSSYLLSKEILAFDAAIKIKFVRPSFAKLSLGDFKGAFLSIDSAKIAVNEESLQNQEENLDSMRRDYEFLYQNIKDQKNQLKKVKELKLFLAKFIKSSYKSKVQLPEYLNNIYLFSTQNFHDISQIDNQAINSPFQIFNNQLIYSLKDYFNNNPSESVNNLAELAYNIEDVNIKNFQNLLLITQNFQNIIKSELGDINASSELKLNISQLKDKPDLAWLATLVDAQNPQESLIKNFKYKNYIHPNIKLLIEEQNFVENVAKNFQNLNFKTNEAYFENFMQLLLKTNLSKKQKNDILIKIIAFKIENAQLNHSLNNLPLFVKKYSFTLSANLQQDISLITNYLKNKKPQTLKNTSNYFKLLNILLKEKKIDDYNPIFTELYNNNSVFENWIKCELAIDYAQKLATENKVDELFASDFQQLTGVQITNENIFLKDYYYQFNLEKAKALYYANQKPESLSFMQAGYNEFSLDTVQFKELIGKTYLKYNLLIAQILVEQKLISEALEYLKTAENYLKYSSNPVDKFLIYYNKAIISKEFKQYEQAIKDYQTAQKLYTTKRLNKKNNIYVIYNDLADIYLVKKQINTANLYLNKALLVASHDSLKIKVLLKQVSILQSSKQYTIALQKLDKAKQFTSKSKENQLKIDNKKAEIYTKIKQYTKATTLLNNLITAKYTNPSINLQNELSNSYFLSAEINRIQAKYTQAMDEYQKCIDLRQLVYETRPGEYEVSIGEAMLKYAMAAYSYLQKDKNKEIHSKGLEKAGLAISILKHYNGLSNKNQQNLEHAIQLRHDFEEIIF